MKIRKSNKFHFGLKLVGGLFIGFTNGFFGVGGGMLAVPFMVYLLKKSEKVSHATAIFIILPLSMISGSVYLFNGIVEWEKLLPVLIGVFAGGILGAIFLNKIKGKTLGILFAIVMIAAGIRMLF